MKDMLFSNPRRTFSVLFMALALALTLPRIVIGTQLETATENTTIFLPIISNPPFLVTSFGGNNNSLLVQDGFAYVGEGSRLSIVDVHNSAQPVPKSSLSLSGVINHVQIVGSLAYIAVSHGGLVIIDISQPANAQQVSQFVSAGQARHVSVLGNLAYLSTSTALQIIDITTPSHPLLLGQYPVDARHTQVVGNKAYVDTGNGFQIVNVGDPHNPSLVGSYYGGDLRQVSGDVAYVTATFCMKGWCDSKLQTVSVNNPSAPTLLDEYQVSGTTNGLWGFQISGDLIFVGINTWLDIVDISDPTHLIRVGRYESPEIVSPFLVMGSFAYMGGNPALDVVNVSDPAHPFLVKTYPAKSADVLISEGNKIYYRTMDQGLGGYTGFQILDVSTPTNPTPAGQYITERGYGAYQVQVVNNLAYVVGDHMTIQFADTHLSLRVEDVHDIYHPMFLIF